MLSGRQIATLNQLWLSFDTDLSIITFLLAPPTPFVDRFANDGDDNDEGAAKGAWEKDNSYTSYRDGLAIHFC